jgi:hypothetical protein
VDLTLLAIAIAPKTFRYFFDLRASGLMLGGGFCIRSLEVLIVIGIREYLFFPMIISIQ